MEFPYCPLTEDDTRKGENENMSLIINFNYYNYFYESKSTI